MSKEIIVIVYRSTWQKWLQGTLMLGVIAGMSVANHRWGGGSSWIDALAVVLGFISLCSTAMPSRNGSFRGTPKQAIEYIGKLSLPAGVDS